VGGSGGSVKGGRRRNFIFIFVPLFIDYFGVKKILVGKHLYFSWFWCR